MKNPEKILMSQTFISSFHPKDAVQEAFLLSGYLTNAQEAWLVKT